MRYQPALADHRAAVEAAREAGDRRLEMVALRELAGDVPVALGRPIEEAVDYLRRALRIAETLGDRRTAASVLGRLATLAANHLRLDQALAVARRGLAVARSSDDDVALAVGLDGLKTVLYFLGELDELAEVCAELEPLVRRQGDLNLLQWTVFESAQCALGGGDWDAAVNRVRAALEVNRRSGYRAYGAWFLAHLGRLEAGRGALDVALEHGRRAVELADGTGHPWWEATTRILLGATLLDAGDAAAARPLLRRGLGHGHGRRRGPPLPQRRPARGGLGRAGDGGDGPPALRAGPRPGRVGLAAGGRRLPGARPGLARARRAGPGRAGRRADAGRGRADRLGAGGGRGDGDWPATPWPRRYRSSLIRAAAVAAPVVSTGRYDGARSISPATASASATGVSWSYGRQRPAPYCWSRCRTCRFCSKWLRSGT